MELTLSPTDLDNVQQLKHAPVEDKLIFVRELLVELKWTLENRRRLGEAWALPPSQLNIFKLKAEAMLAAAIADPEELRAKLIEQIHFVSADALNKRRAFLNKEGDVVMAPDPDHKSAISGLLGIAKMAGLLSKPPPDKPNKFIDNDIDELVELANQRQLPERDTAKELENENELQSKRSETELAD